MQPSKRIVACELLPGGCCNMVCIKTPKCPSTRSWSWPDYRARRQLSWPFENSAHERIKLLWLWLRNIPFWPDLMLLIDAAYISLLLARCFIYKCECSNTWKGWIIQTPSMVNCSHQHGLLQLWRETGCRGQCFTSDEHSNPSIEFMIT